MKNLNKTLKVINIKKLSLSFNEIIIRKFVKIF